MNLASLETSNRSPDKHSLDKQFGLEYPFVARLKKSSKYYRQAAPGTWFEIVFRYRYDDYCIVGNNNVYRLRDVQIGARRPDGKIVTLS